MIQSLRPADASLRQPAPLTFRSIAVTTLFALTVSVAIAVHGGV